MTEKCQNIFLDINKMIEKRRIKLKNDYKNHFSDKTITKYTTKITPSPKIQNLSTFLSQKLAFSPAMFPDSSQKSFFFWLQTPPRATATRNLQKKGRQPDATTRHSRKIRDEDHTSTPQRGGGGRGGGGWHSKVNVFSSPPRMAPCIGATGGGGAF